jgi:hypothetical protein
MDQSHTSPAASHEARRAAVVVVHRRTVAGQTPGRSEMS